MNTSYDQSLTSHVEPIAAGAQAVAAAFVGKRPVLALADGTLLFTDNSERIVAHAEGAILFAAALSDRIVTGGDDGRVVATLADGATSELGHEKNKWIDALAVRDDGAVAWSAGKDVRARDAKGVVKSYVAPSGVRGLAFLPKGYRLAMSHYNGASLWFPNTAAEPDVLKWSGSHLDITISPDGQFCVTAMQENALHGWRISDKKDMRMTGYPSKTRSFSWSPDGQWLATSGADACVIWPFQSKDGPMGKAPRECGVRPARVSRVAFHPSLPIVALGYDDGWVLLCRTTDSAELLVRKGLEETDEVDDRNRPRAPVSALAWDKDGKRLLFGLETGEAGLLTLPAA
jgi:WD40 repeat protein